MTMTQVPQLQTRYRPSEDVVARQIEGEVLLVPLVAGIGDMEDDIFTMNPSGKAIWERLDGTRSLAEVVDELAAAYQVTPAEMEQDVCGFVGELLKRSMLVPAV